MRFSRTGRPTLRPWLKLISLILGVGFLALLIKNYLNPSSDIISPLPDEPKTQSPWFIFSRRKDPGDLKRNLEKLIGNSWPNYSILVEDFNSDFSLGINETVIFIGASVNKLPILLSLYLLVNNGQVDLEENVTIQEEDIQAYGTGSIQYDPAGTVYSIKTLARLMIQKSDNTAAYVLGNHVIGLDKVQQIINGWGLTQTDMVNNKTSNKDISLLFRKLMNGEVANQALTSEILSFLKDSDFEDRLPALLPPEAVVYHKIGTEVRRIHDVGVVTDGKLKYYVGILTSDVDNEDESIKLIAKLSQAIFKFMR